jgi:hypothetical protein
MVPSVDYRRYAQQCVDTAKHAPPDERKDLLEMAQAWLALARDTDASDMKTKPGRGRQASGR